MNPRFLLLCTATQAEMDCLLPLPSFVHPLVCGVGIAATLHSLYTYQINNTLPKLVIQAGLAGLYTHEPDPQGIYVISSERYADLGLESGQEPRTLTLYPPHQPIFYAHKQYWSSLQNNPVQQAQGLTVQCCTGTETTQQMMSKAHNLEPGEFYTESMEGMPLAEWAEKLSLPWLQIRSISNRVGKRSITAHSIERSLAELGMYFKKIDWNLLCNSI